MNDRTGIWIHFDFKIHGFWSVKFQISTRSQKLESNYILQYSKFKTVHRVQSLPYSVFWKHKDNIIGLGKVQFLLKTQPECAGKGNTPRHLKAFPPINTKHFS